MYKILQDKFSKEEIDFILQKLPRLYIFKETSSVNLSAGLYAEKKSFYHSEAVYKLESNNVLYVVNKNNNLHNVDTKYYKQYKSEKNKFKKYILNMLAESDDYEIASNYSGQIILKTYKITREPIFLYKARLMEEGRTLLKSEKMKKVWQNRKNKRSVIFEKTKTKKQKSNA